jgi:hypothetical protein
MQNPKKSPSFILLLLLLCVFSIQAQKKLTDFTYQIQTNKSLEINTYVGENGVFWVRTKSNPSNEDELSVFDPKKGEIIKINDSKLPKKFFIRNFYQHQNLGFFLMQNQENFLPFFVVINQEGKILEKNDFLANVNSEPKLIGIENEVYFSILNDFYKYDFDKLQKIEIPKHNDKNIQLSQNHSLFKSQKEWIVLDQDLLITSKQVIKASTFLNDPTFKLHQLDDDLLAQTKNGIFEMLAVDGKLELKNIFGANNLFFSGKYNQKFVFGKSLNSKVSYYYYENKTLIELQEEIPDKSGAFFENDTIKLVFGVNGGFAGGAFYYTTSLYSKNDSITYDLLDFMDRMAKHANFQINSFTSIFNFTKDFTALIIRSIGNPDRIVTFRNNTKFKNPYIIEKVTEADPKKWIVKDFLNYFYYLNTQTLEIELINDPFKDREATYFTENLTKIGTQINIDQNYFYLPYNGQITKNANKIIKDTITINNNYQSINSPINLLKSQSQKHSIYSFNEKNEIKFLKIENDQLFLKYSKDTIVFNIGYSKNLNFPSVYILSKDEIIISFNNVNNYYNLKSGTNTNLGFGYLNVLLDDLIDLTKKNLIRISNNNNTNYFYFLNGALKSIPELKNKWYNFVSNSGNRILFHNQINSIGQIVNTEYFDLENLKKINLSYDKLSTLEGFYWPYFLFVTNTQYNSPTKIGIFNIDDKQIIEMQYKYYIENTKFIFKSNNLFFSFYDQKSGSLKIIKTDWKLKKNYELTWKVEYLSFNKELLVLSRNNKKILLNLENTNNLFDIGLIKNDFYNITIDQFDTEKTPYWFGNLADWDNTNLFRLEKSDIKYEDLEWIELDDEDWSFSEIIEEPQTRVFPNPNFGYLTIEVKDLIEKVALLDNQGKIILEMENPVVNGNAFQNQNFIKEVEGASGWSIRNTNSPIVFFIFSFANGKKVTQKIMTAK